MVRTRVCSLIFRRFESPISPPPQDAIHTNIFKRYFLQRNLGDFKLGGRLHFFDVGMSEFSISLFQVKLIASAFISGFF
jgi:hypothetical protein